MKRVEAIYETQKIKEETSFDPYYSCLDSALSDKIIIEGKEYINLASNNYLGLADDQRVKEAVIESINKYGVSLCGTPIAVGYSSVGKRVERRLAEFVGVEETILLPSCYQANNGIFDMLAEKEDIIIFDHYIHSSLLQGIQSASCRNRAFLHNNLVHLEGILEKAQNYNHRWIVTESVFSTEGQLAPVDQLLDLCEKYNCTLVVDDSHGIGVIGSGGRGALKLNGINNSKRVVYTASLGKAIANLGGVIGADKETIEYLRYYFPHLIYSTALPPMVISGVEKVLDILKKDYEEINNKVWEYKKLIGEALVKKGFEIVESKSPINSIIGGDKINTINIAKKFFEKGILVTPFVEPSVPPKEGRIRIIAGANLTSDTITNVIKIIEDL